MQKIYVQLLEEGTTVYVPILANKLSDDSYQLISNNASLSTEDKLEFKIGSKVKVEIRENSAGQKLLFATGIISDPT